MDDPKAHALVSHTYGAKTVPAGTDSFVQDDAATVSRRKDTGNTGAIINT